MPTPAIRNSYEPVGCFHDKGVAPRPLPEFLGSFRKEINWKHVELTVDKCAKLAQKKGYAYFSVQYYAECWSGPEAGDTYAREGKATNCLNDAVGTSFTNYVYRFVN
ncbi:unnamed protein product [Pocillopora meandrina]|uniref:WSC domain-containing protein n=1 Tax=Pocillopora meandrina TaxID=46732 RepID=A0AAU9WSZ3_9CNID|nr:unnamed protein product [Pocillopora meandrina]